jgi:hypothetical protein
MSTVMRRGTALRPFPRLCQPASAALRGLFAFAGIVTRQHDTMFENVDGKEFVDVSSGMGEDSLRMGCQRGSAFVDLDDGFMDLLSSAANGGHWLLMKLAGVKCNRDARGPGSAQWCGPPGQL